MIQEKIKKVQDKIDEVQSSKDTLSKRVLENQSKINEYERNLERRGEMEKRLSELENYDTSNDDALIDKLVSDLTDLAENYKVKVKELEDSKCDLEDLSIVKELFSSSGIRSSIINRIVDLFNKTLDSYLKRLEAPCKIIFDENFTPDIRTMGGIDIEFDNLSSGEKHRVNTALAFTFKDILRIQNQVSFNLSIIDEVFDSSIDSRALGIYGDILKERFDTLDESSYIISHRESFEVDGSQEITVIKEEGVSYVK